MPALTSRLREVNSLSLAHAVEYLISRDVSNVAAVRALPMAVPLVGSSPLLLARREIRQKVTEDFVIQH
jgi:hypothetical protein